ncbi:hypothetical protein [uncultured Muribaculum sp.]|uniref:hypothetical protein n=1 Tax=uncultured Muribaculum sp. TaxID=1918613 RepID=UPI0025B1F46E|nr:hypothetical protein [uncultured Muribaculum sp.]
MEQPYQEIDEKFTHVNYSETSEVFQNKSYAETSQPSTSVTASEVSPSQNNQPSRDNHFHDGDSTVQNNFTVGGTFRAKRFIHPFGARFHDLNELKAEYPTPVKGMWAWVGIDFPGEIWVCEVDGTWKLLNQSSVTADQLTTILSSYATQSWVASQGYLTQHQSLASYATQSWVLEQINALNIGSGGSDVDLSEFDKKLSKKLDKAAFDDLFEKVNIGTDAAPKWAIKAKYNFYTVGWLSFRGANDGSGGSAVAGAANLADLKDVSLGSLAAGQALVWNGAKWVNSTIATSGLDEASLSNYLTSHSYATQSWVTAQGFLKQHQSLADYLKIDGSNGTAAGVTALIKHLDDATADILDTTKLVTSDTLGDNAASRMYHRRPATALWNYIKSKSDALYVTAIGTSGNNLTYIKGGITNNITVPYAAKTRLLEEAYGLARGSYDALQERPDELPAGLRVKFKGYLGAGAGPESYWNTVLDITAVSGGSVTGAGYRTQFLFSNSLNESDGTFWVRNGIDATWNSWQQVFTTGNYQGLLANTFYNKTEVDAKLDKKLDKATFDDLFEKVNLGTDAAPKWVIKAKYSFHTVGWLSFRGPNDGSGGSASAGAANLADLKDVSLGSLVAGQALVWNGAKWVNSTIATSGLDEASLANYLSSHGYATQSWANGAFVNKVGDTMTGHLTMLAKDVYLKNSTDNSQYVCYGFKNTANAIIAQVGYHNTAKRIVINPVGSSEPWVDAVGKYNLIVGNNELKYNTYTLWHSGNDGHNSGLDADLLDGVHNGEVTARLVNYNNGGNVSGAVQFMQKDKGWNAWDAPTQNWYSVIKLNHGNGDTYYSRVLAFDFHSDNIYTHRKRNGTDYGWHTLAFIDSTVANANSLGGIAAGDYVTRNGDQKIGGVKTFTTYVKNEMASMFKAGSDGIYFAPDTNGSLRINTHTNYSYTGYIGRISQDGSLTMGSFIKSGGTASQFLKADGSVDGTSYATASALSTGLAGKVSKSGDTMSGDLWFGAPDKGVKFNHAGINGIWGHTRDNAATNQIGSTALSNLVIASHWGVAFTSTCSNQTYTDKVAVGIDTRIGSVAAGSWVKASHFLANTTRLCTNLNADLLDSYHVSQLARLTSANASAGAHNLPVYVNGGVVNAVSSVGEAFLSWGGRSLSGGFSPVDGAMVGALGANRFAFIKPAGTTFQYSTNSGSTWNNYNLSDTQKSGFFDAGVQQALYASGASNVVGTASHQLRIIIATSAARIYTAINKFVINFSTQGCHGTTVTIEKALESTPDNWVTVASNVPLYGWSGWNVVNIPAFLTYGNSPGVQYGRIRFTFKCTSVGSNNSPFKVYCIMAYGGFGWTTASSMAANGHLYSYDGEQNAYFPGCVTVNKGGQYAGTGWNNGAGQLGIALVNNSNQTPLLVAHRYGAASDVTGANRLFALELLNSGAEMHFAFGGSTKFSMTSAGVFFANGGIWTNGYLSFRGQNTSSDARQKRILRDIHVPLATIAKAPNIVFSWLDTGKLDMGSIAQYWQKHLPLSVYVRPNGYLGMDYSKVALACVISMASELLGVKDDVSTLKRELRQLKHENQQLKQQIITLERRIA